MDAQGRSSVMQTFMPLNLTSLFISLYADYVEKGNTLALMRISYIHFSYIHFPTDMVIQTFYIPIVELIQS